MERFCEASHKCREVALKIYTRPQGGNSTTSTDNERFQAGAEDSRMRLVDSEDTIVKWCAVTDGPSLHECWGYPCLAARTIVDYGHRHLVQLQEISTEFRWPATCAIVQIVPHLIICGLVATAWPYAPRQESTPFPAQSHTPSDSFHAVSVRGYQISSPAYLTDNARPAWLPHR